MTKSTASPLRQSFDFPSSSRLRRTDEWSEFRAEQERGQMREITARILGRPASDQQSGDQGRAEGGRE